MFFVLSKTIGLLVKPLTWLIILLFIAVFSRKPKLRKISLIATLSILLIFTNPFVINISLKLWEPSPVAITSMPTYDIGILLGGFSRHLPETDNIQLTEAGDRLWQTLILYKQGKIKNILITGSDHKYAKPEAKAVYDVLISIGIPDSVLIVEDKSRNTRENAVFSAKLLETNLPNASCVLITTALHMERSLGCFRKVGLNPDSFPVDHISRHDNVYWVRWFRPDPSALNKWDRVINEWAGIIIYKLRGYI